MESKYDIELYKMKAEMCKSMADPTRLMIIQELKDGEKSVGELTNVLGTHQAAVSRHLAVLRDKGFVVSRREGTSMYYSLSNDRIADACTLVHEILLSHLAKNREFAERVIS